MALPPESPYFLLQNIIQENFFSAFFLDSKKILNIFKTVTKIKGVGFCKFLA